ncbi:MAG: phosphoglycolate phosphatase [Betaproteobacteria bacterium]|nr:phosphoglycolate phosphatase [Betaproteobacteria bacterium]
MTADAGVITGRRQAPSRLPVRGVLFDLDGTLVDSAPDLGAAVNRMRIGRGLAPLPDAELRPHASAGARGLIGAGLGITPAEPEYLPLRDEFLGYYFEALCVRTVLFPGVAALLDALETAGLPWGIVTNKATRLTLPLLDALQLRWRTGCIVCGDTTARAKPHPEPLLAAAGMLALPPVACVYVGDAERDVEAGNAAGMSTLVARYGYIRQDETPDLWPAHGQLDSAMDLLSWLPVGGHRAG